MFNKLKAVENKYEELTHKLTLPEVLSDADSYKKIATEHAEIAEIVERYREYKAALATRNEARQLLGSNIDDDFRALAKEEFDEASERMERLETELKKLLMPKDPNDNKNVIFEIRAGAGGEEAALFAAVLFRMYSMYAERHRWSVEIVDISDTGIGGIKEIVFTINGKGAYSRLKFESGVHRVQRVPATETGGRIHTSTATVAVLPEVDEVEVELNMNDVEVDTFRSSGAGGQHINKTESAIRLTHKPTGIVVTCQDEKSQLKNKEQAFKVLRSKLYEKYKNEQESEVAQARKSQVGTGDRSERIRTYNYTQNRVTDHRIDLTLYKLEMILNGDLEEVIDALITSDESAKLSVTEE